MFVKWSDGVTKRTRTDTNFDQNVDVTAVFAAASIQVSSSGKAGLGDSYTFKATLKGKYLDASSIRWYVNGTDVYKRQPPRLCYRNLFYTGVTRARRLCVVAGRRDVVNSMMSNIRQNLRYSGLCALLQAGQPPQQLSTEGESP